MKKTIFIQIATMIFIIVALLHSFRIVYEVPATIGDWDIPMWISYLPTIGLAILAINGVKILKK